MQLVDVADGGSERQGPDVKERRSKRKFEKSEERDQGGRQGDQGRSEGYQGRAEGAGQTLAGRPPRVHRVPDGEAAVQADREPNRILVFIAVFRLKVC